MVCSVLVADEIEGRACTTYCCWVFVLLVMREGCLQREMIDGAMETKVEDWCCLLHEMVVW